jgi:hypothetical protein
LTALVVLATPVTLAGSSGQQIEISFGTSTHSFEISGDNQIGEEIHQGLNTDGNPTKDTGYWWENTIKITSYTGSNQTGTDEGTLSCDVPVSQGSNWFSCSAY